MKKLVMILAILFTFTVAASAQTPAPTPFSIYAGGALSLPNSPDAFKDGFKTGYHGLLGLGFDVAPKFQVIGKVEYHTFQVDFDESMSEYSGGTNKMWMFGADAKFNPSLPALPISPYVLGGVGFANIKQSEFEGPASLSLSLLNEFVSESQTELYWNLGVGTELKTSPMFSLFAQARYVSIQTEGESSSFIPISLGLKFF